MKEKFLKREQAIWEQAEEKLTLSFAERMKKLENRFKEEVKHLKNEYRAL